MSDRERKAILRAKLLRFQWDEEHGKRIKFRKPDKPKRPVAPPRPPKPKSIMTIPDAIVRVLQDRGGGPLSPMAVYDEAVRRGWLIPARSGADGPVQLAVRSLRADGRIVVLPGRWPRWIALIESAIPDGPEMPPFPAPGAGAIGSSMAHDLLGAEADGSLGSE